MFSSYLAATAENTQTQEDSIAAAFIYGLAAIAIFIGLWNLLIAILGLFPKCQASAVGTLTKATTKKNFRTRHGYLIPRLTHYAYTYRVKSKQYRYSREMRHSKRRLLPKVWLVYVKWFPRHAYPNKFTGTQEWVIGVCMLLIGTMFLCALSST